MSLLESLSSHSGQEVPKLKSEGHKEDGVTAARAVLVALLVAIKGAVTCSLTSRLSSARHESSMLQCPY